MVPPDMVAESRPVVYKWLVAAVERNGGQESAYDVMVACESRVAQMWLAIVDRKPVGVVVTEALKYSRRKILQVSYLGGECLDAWLDEQSVLEDFARENGCSALRMRGRDGWQRKLANKGWRKTAVELEMPL